MNNGKRVAVIGLGYVGLPLALLAAKKGHAVTGFDLDTDKISKLKNKQDPIGDDYIKKHLKESKLKVTNDFKKLKSAEVVLVCVPTPVKNDYKPNLEPLKGALKSIASHLPNQALIVIESTINPGVCDEVAIPIIEEISQKKVNKDFYLAHCPERINPGDPKWTVENIPRVVGASSKNSLNQAVKFYESIVDAQIKPMGSLKEAESVKIVENSFRDINLAFVNELAVSFTKLGIDVKNVIDGAATKPFAFMPHYPGVGVGGHCIPVDPYYLIEYAKGYGFNHEFLALARSINNHMPEFTVDRLMDGLDEAGLTLMGTKIAVLGLAYKPNVADDRESPAYKLIAILEEKGAKVQTFDPHLTEKSSVNTLAGALAGAQAVVITTNHQEFMDYDFGQHKKLKVFVDGKNAFDSKVISKIDIIYRGVGR